MLLGEILLRLWRGRARAQHVSGVAHYKLKSIDAGRPGREKRHPEANTLCPFFFFPFWGGGARQDAGQDKSESKGYGPWLCRAAFVDARVRAKNGKYKAKVESFRDDIEIDERAIEEVSKY